MPASVRSIKRAWLQTCRLVTIIIINPYISYPVVWTVSLLLKDIWFSINWWSSLLLITDWWLSLIWIHTYIYHHTQLYELFVGYIHAYLIQNNYSFYMLANWVFICLQIEHSLKIYTEIYRFHISLKNII